MIKKRLLKIAKLLLVSILSVPLLYGVWLLTRMLVFDYFTIPTESMYPTLKPGEKVVVNKLKMGARIYTDYAYNALVKVLVEQGLAGALLWIAIVLTAMWRLYKASGPLFMGMVSLLVFSMFSYPFELLPYRIIAVMTFAWSESRRKSVFCLHMNKF